MGAIPQLKTGIGWTKSGRLLLFEIANGTDYLKLRLTIGPGQQNIREALFNMARENPALYRGTK
jgi:hypothetical protein